MSVYDPLSDYLAQFPGRQVCLSFSEIEKMLGRPLPASAGSYRQWWANGYSSPGRQCSAWLSVGWRVDSVSFSRQSVTFSKP